MSPSVAAGAVRPSYEHVSKLVRPGAALAVSGGLLKWYEIAPPDRPISGEVAAHHNHRTNLRLEEAEPIDLVRTESRTQNQHSKIFERSGQVWNRPRAHFPRAPKLNGRLLKPRPAGAGLHRRDPRLRDIHRPQ